MSSLIVDWEKFDVGSKNGLSITAGFSKSINRKFVASIVDYLRSSKICFCSRLISSVSKLSSGF